MAPTIHLRVCLTIGPLLLFGLQVLERLYYCLVKKSTARCTLSAGVTPICLSTILPFSSIIKWLRMMPMYVLPYNSFSPQTPYLSATWCAGSERSTEARLNLARKRCRSSNESGLTPMTTALALAILSDSSRNPTACSVQPLVPALG